MERLGWLKATILENKLIPVNDDRPSKRQAEFLMRDEMEVLYGGAAGGGKSDALLMAALQYCHLPKYSALLLRKTYADLSLPGALIDRASEWLRGKARWNEWEKTWHFASGATLTFGYLDNPRQMFRYASSEFQFIGFDELTQFGEREYRFLFSRLRKTKDNPAPLRMRAASNPGGVGHNWVKRRFVKAGPEAKGVRAFVPAKKGDNPGIDLEGYAASLANLDPKTRRQLDEGDWDASNDTLIEYDWLEACTVSECLWPGLVVPSGVYPELYHGVDIGRNHDRSCCWTWDKVGDVAWCRDVAVFHKMPYSQQFAEISKRITPYSVRMLVDKGTVGAQIAEDLERKHPGVVVGVGVGEGPQIRMASRLAVYMEAKRCRLPDDPEIWEDFSLVSKGGKGIETKRDKIGHADRFWAAGLALEAMELEPPPVVARAPVYR